MERRKYLAGVLVASCAAGCATTSVQSDRDPNVDLARYQTFQVARGQVTKNGVVDQRDTLTRDRVESSLGAKLQEKGLEPAEPAQAPDLIATYTAGGVEVIEYRDDAFTDYPSAWGGAWAEEDVESELVIDLIDAKTRKLVWRSVVEFDDDDPRNAKTIDKAVDAGLEKYPGPLSAY